MKKDQLDALIAEMVRTNVNAGEVEVYGMEMLRDAILAAVNESAERPFTRSEWLYRSNPG